MGWLGVVRELLVMWRSVIQIEGSKLVFMDMWTDNSTVVEITGRPFLLYVRKLYHSCRSRNEKELLGCSGFFDDTCMWDLCRVDDNNDP